MRCRERACSLTVGRVCGAVPPAGPSLTSRLSAQPEPGMICAAKTSLSCGRTAVAYTPMIAILIVLNGRQRLSHPPSHHEAQAAKGDQEDGKS